MTAKEILKSKKFWTLIAAIVAALSAFFATSCTVTHKVVQSAYNTATGDSIVIRYEQTGNGFKSN